MISWLPRAVLKCLRWEWVPGPPGGPLSCRHGAAAFCQHRFCLGVPDQLLLCSVVLLHFAVVRLLQCFGAVPYQLPLTITRLPNFPAGLRPHLCLRLGPAARQPGCAGQRAGGGRASAARCALQGKCALYLIPWLFGQDAGLASAVCVRSEVGVAGGVGAGHLWVSAGRLPSWAKESAV